jgi:hypothetical protein
LNEAREPIYKEQWELQSGLSRLGLRKKPGRAPKWRWSEKTGKLVRRSKGNGVDWYRYQHEVLLLKLLPFAKKCQQAHSVIVQEDKAPAHNHFDQHRVFSVYAVERLLWCGNSPDLNAIEPCWYWMKRQTTKKGPPKSRAEAVKVWTACWNKELSQEQIQA